MNDVDNPRPILGVRLIDKRGNKVKSKDTRAWLEQNLSRFENLTQAVVSITRILLTDSGIEFLAVTGRTKSLPGCLEKVKRKRYRDPPSQLTDISGIRIIVYYESDIARLSEIIERSFSVDKENSLDKDTLLSTNQVGYRSVHFVCDLGVARSGLPEFVGLNGLKFEFQIRTVLQHAWAELAHDRNYKFSGSLPREIERKLYLFSGMLEIADKGFSELAKQIDSYTEEVEAGYSHGQLDVELNSISVEQFVKQWAERNSVEFTPLDKGPYEELIRELNDFGIRNIKELNAIIPKNYTASGKGYTTLFGIVRSWMMIHDIRRFLSDVEVDWMIREKERVWLSTFLSGDDIEALMDKLGWDDEVEEEGEISEEVDQADDNS